MLALEAELIILRKTVWAVPGSTLMASGGHLMGTGGTGTQAGGQRLGTEKELQNS